MTDLLATLNGQPETEIAPSAPEHPATAGLPAPKALLFFLSHQDNYRRPLFSPNEVFCSPDTEGRSISGKISALKTPEGAFDVSTIVNQLPADQYPEIVVVKADATCRNLPRNLASLRCPKILIVGDTHHMAQPLNRVIAYARSEPFDQIIFDHTRHHAHFFAEAGLKSLHWLPAIDYGYTPREIAATPAHAVTFVGQAGRHHPWRRAVLDHVKAAGLPLQMLRGTLAETADIYASSQITLNASLNGDLNLRVFESLAAGGFLLTDELSEASGLRLLFEPGRHLDTWSSAGELVEKIRHYLANPGEARRIRTEGQAEVRRAHHPAVKLREFYDLVFSGRVNPRYDLAIDQRFIQLAAPSPANSAAAQAQERRRTAYEVLQGLHQRSSEVRIFCRNPSALADLADLPRLRFVALEELNTSPTAADASLSAAPAVGVLWADAPAAELAQWLPKFAGRHAILPTADKALAEEFKAWGFVANDEQRMHLQRLNPVAGLQRAWDAGERDSIRARLPALLRESHDSNESLALGNFALELGDGAVLLAALEQAVGLDRNNQAALLAYAAVLIDSDAGAPATLIVLEEAARLGALQPEVEELRLKLAAEVGADPSLEPYYHGINRAAPKKAAQPRRILMVTNLFPPQELGGYGRKMWEFANGLRARGHEVRVLAANSPALAKKPTPDEVELDKVVTRRLELLGGWSDGKPFDIKRPKEIETRIKANSRLIRTTAKSMKADVVFAGNLDFIGVSAIHTALEENLPVLQALGNPTPGYQPVEQPASARYCIGAASQYCVNAVRQSGYMPARIEVVYPGARIDRFFRVFLPDTRRLRLCFAGLVMPFKGAHIMAEALVRLHQRGVDFTAEIAGDAPDSAFLNKLRDYLKAYGLADRVKFTGFLDRSGLAAMFARNNVLLFPTQVAELFGISQVEAMAAGLVVVSSGMGGTREVIRDGVDGLFFNPTDPGDLAEKLHGLASNPDRFAQLQRASQARATEFAVERSVEKIEGLIEDLLATPA
jgi:glycosyltransferase involved in cell wall biosynthesis